jgi:catechol 2,3-dioxygenase-like lactoylglutathione lyase family enzyme
MQASAARDRQQADECDIHRHPTLWLSHPSGCSKGERGRSAGGQARGGGGLPGRPAGAAAARDVPGCGPGPDAGPGGVTLAHNVGSPGEVDAIIDAARAAGAVIGREPARTFWGGYSGVFIDPDGHPWEVVHDPAGS